MTLIALFSVLGIIFTAAFFLWKVIQLILLGPPNPEWSEGEHKLQDLNRSETWILGPIAACTLVFGIIPGILLVAINASSLNILAQASNVQVALLSLFK